MNLKNVKQQSTHNGFQKFGKQLLQQNWVTTMVSGVYGSICRPFLKGG